MYKIFIAPFLRRLNSETASRIAKRYFRFVGSIPGGRWINRLIHGNRATGLQKEVFGLNFYNPLGLEAGLDRDANLYNDLNDLGFSFSEIGPLDEEKTKKAVRNIQIDPQNDILAACIGKDFLRCFTLAYDFCDFFVIETGDEFTEDVIEPLLSARLTYDEYKPIVVKLRENAAKSEIKDIVSYCLMNGIDGIQTRDKEQTQVVAELVEGRLPIMANCQAQSVEEAKELLDMGASLLEIRNGLVYEGPSLVRKILRHLEANSKNEKNTDRI